MDEADFYNEEFLKIKDNVEEIFNKLCCLWDEVGSRKDNRASNKMQLISSCSEVVSSHLNAVYEKEKKRRDDYYVHISNGKECVYELCKKLGISTENVFLNEKGVDILQGQTLKDQEKIINHYKSSLSNKYAERQIEVNNILAKMKSIYDELGQKMDSSYCNIENFMTENGIDMLNQTYQKCEYTRNLRRKKVTEISGLIYHFCISLGISLENTNNDVDKLILSKPSTIPITDCMLLNLDSRLSDLYKLQQTRVKTINEYNKQIGTLWIMLETSSEQQDQFTLHCPKDLSNDTITYYQQYIQQLQGEVQSKLRQLIPSLRTKMLEIIHIINSYTNLLESYDLSFLHIPEEQFSKDLLEQHQQALVQLEEFKKQLDPIITKIDQREHVLNNKIELDALLKDPSRLTDKRNSFKLLQRQRQLEKEVKSLPIINNELRRLIQEYESQYGEIIINGERLIDQLPEQEEIRPRSTMSSIRSSLSVYR